MITAYRLEKEIINEYGEQEYSLMEKLVLSHPKYDIVIPRNTITIYEESHEIIYHYLLSQRTITPINASAKYWYAMKCNNISFKLRLWKYFKALETFFNVNVCLNGFR